MGYWGHKRSSRSIGIVLAAATLLAMTPWGASARDYGFGEYTLGTQSGCSVRKDPVNMYYVDFTSTSARSVTTDVIGLTWGPIASTQYFDLISGVDGHASCPGQWDQKASWPTGPKEHTRLRANPQGTINSIWWVTASPIHHDEIDVFCGDYSTSFNGPRDWAQGRINGGGYTTAKVFTGNNAAIQQCNGNWVASDGSYVRVEW